MKEKLVKILFIEPKLLEPFELVHFKAQQASFGNNFWLQTLPQIRISYASESFACVWLDSTWRLATED